MTLLWELPPVYFVVNMVSIMLSAYVIWNLQCDTDK